MKKIILSIFTLLAIGTVVNAQNVNITDANFKTYLVGNVAINTNGDTEIQLSEASAFTGNVNCQNLNITDLTGIEAFTDINYLYCNDNQLANLDISNCVDLLGLRCHNNQLTSLDLSNNIYLTEIYCYANNLANLDVLNLTDLETFRGQTNQISSLDFSGASNLVYVKCGYNNLSYLNVANGNNANMLSFHAQSNPSLTCIEVDDVAYSTTNWTIVDVASSFSTNCSGSILVNSITIQGQGGVSTITTQGGTLQIEATVLPANADDMTFTWSVVNGTGSASIDANGILTAITDGTVDVIATANDASGEMGMTTITISNQSLSFDETDVNSLVKVYPNPVQNEIFIETSELNIIEMIILDHSGRVVKTCTNSAASSIDVSDLKEGIYILKISTENGISTKRFVKE